MPAYYELLRLTAFEVSVAVRLRALGFRGLAYEFIALFLLHIALVSQSAPVSLMQILSLSFLEVHR